MPRPSLRSCRNLDAGCQSSFLSGVKQWEEAQSYGGKKNVYLIRWPLKAPGFCQYKKGSKMTRSGDMEQAQKKGKGHQVT